MRILDIIRDLLTEATGEEIYQKYYSDITWDAFYRIVIADPKTKVEGQNKNIIKIGKYAKILLNLYKNKTLKFEDLPKATQYLDVVYTRHIPLNINKIKTLADLYLLVKEYIGDGNISFDEAISWLDKSEYEHVFEGKNCDIYVPLTERAACYLGVGTEWCTTWGKYSLSKENKTLTNRFDFYNSEGKLYIIIDKSDKRFGKFQFHFETNQFMDAADEQIETDNLLDDGWKEVVNFFFPSLFIKTPTEEQLLSDFQKSELLPKKYKDVLLKKLLTISKNLFMIAAAKDNNELLAKLFKDNIIEEVQFYETSRKKKVIDIDTKNLHSDAMDDVFMIERYLTYEWHYESLLYNYFDADTIDNLYEEYKQTYREKRIAFILNKFVSMEFFDKIDDKKLKKKFDEVFRDKFSYEAVDVLSTICDSEITKLNTYFAVDTSYGGGYNIKFEKTFFLTYVVANNINSIDNLKEFVEGYLDFYNLPSEIYSADEIIRDAFYNQVKYPKYEDMEEIFDEYYIDISDDIETSSGQQLQDIIQQFDFKMETLDKRVFENQYVKLVIFLNSFDEYEPDKIGVEYTNKKTRRKLKGKILIKNIPRYITTYPLHELFEK